MGFSLKKAAKKIQAILTDTNGDPLTIDDGALHVHIPGEIDDGNSSTTTLGIGETFIGVGKELLDYAVYFVNIYSDVASTTDGLMIETSSDNVTWRDGDVYTVAADTSKTFSFQASPKYYRIKYTNGAIAQATFDLQVVLKRTDSKPSSHRIADAISGQDDATLQKSVLTGYNNFTDSFTNINASRSNNLQVTDAENGLAIAKGEVSGTSFIAKFGNAHDFDIGDGYVNIWDGADDGNTNIMTYTYSTIADINRISSDNAGDTQDILVTGLDSDWNEVSQTITLNGQTPVTLSTTLIRCYRMKNVDSTELTGFVYCYTSAAVVVGGVPTVGSTVRAIIENGEGQTLMALVSIPAGKTGYLQSWYFSSSGAKRTSTHTMKLRVRTFGGVFLTKHVQAISLAGSSSIEHKYKIPLPYPEKTDIEMLSNTDENEAGVSGGFDIVLVDN